MEEPQSAALTDFWATRLRQQKKIKVDVPDDVTLHITKASLDADAAAGRNVVLCRHDQGAETAVCALSIDGAECFDLSGLVVTGETLEFYNRGNSTVHLSGYTVDDSAEGGEEDGDVLTDEETAAIQASMARGDDMEVSSDEDEDEDDDGGEGGEGEGEESESPEGGDGGSEGSDGSGSSGGSEEEEDDESESESESEEEEEAAAPPPKKKAKPAEAAKPAKSAAAPAAKLAPDSEAGRAALAKWRDACAAVVKANPGTKLTALGQQQPLPTSGKLSKQLGQRFVIDKQTQEVTLS